MALVRCKECNNQVSDSSKNCPQCGAKVNDSFSIYKLMGIVILALIIIGYFSNNKEVGSSSAPPLATNENAAPITANKSKVTIENSLFMLAVAYDTNSAAGDAEYKDKILKFSGVIVEINTWGDDVVLMFSPTTNDYIFATLKNSEKSKAIHLGKGQTIAFQCRVEGGDSSTVSLADCVIL